MVSSWHHDRITHMPLAQQIICVVGPTASGKSDLAQHIALHLNGEVVGADSMQIYRGMDIGTGKVLPDERMVAHYGIDLVDPGEPYSAALYQRYARSIFDSVDARSKRVILAGGTGLYIRAAVDAYDFPSGEQENNPVREKYEQYLEENGAASLWDLLNSHDADSAAVIHPNNSRRVIRALELYENGESYAVNKARLAELPPFVPAVMIGLRVDPRVLASRIDQRVDGMIETGLLEEVHRLLGIGFREGLTAPQAIGYKEIVEAIDGRISMFDAIEKIKQSTKRYAKRQRTWFNKDSRIHWIDATEYDIEALTSSALDIVRQSDESYFDRLTID